MRFPVSLTETAVLSRSRPPFLFACAPGGARFSRVQVPNPPGSGKDVAEGKGAHREVESEGSRMWGTN